MCSFSGEWSGSSHPWPGGCPALSGGLRGRGQREQGPARPPSLLSISLVNLSSQPPSLNLSPGAARPLPLPPSPCLGSPAPHPSPPARPPVLDLQGPLLLGQHLPLLLPGTRPRLVSIKLIRL